MRTLTESAAENSVTTQSLDKRLPDGCSPSQVCAALSAFLASAPRREPKCRHKPSIALFIAKPTHELPSVRIPQGHRISQGAKLFGVDSLARPTGGERRATSLPRRVIVCETHRSAEQDTPETGSLDKVPLAEMQKIEPAITAKVYDVLTLDASVNARTSFGGTAPVRVREQVQFWREKLK